MRTALTSSRVPVCLDSGEAPVSTVSRQPLKTSLYNIGFVMELPSDINQEIT